MPDRKLYFPIGQKKLTLKGEIKKTKKPHFKSEVNGLVCSMASQERFELPTVRLEGVCSIRLSYWDIFSYQRQDLLYYPNI